MSLSIVNKATGERLGWADENGTFSELTFDWEDTDVDTLQTIEFLDRLTGDNWQLSES